jgi:hypothetical protein
MENAKKTKVNFNFNKNGQLKPIVKAPLKEYLIYGKKM